jgi:molybdate transport system substrate-binding protein
MTPTRWATGFTLATGLFSPGCSKHGAPGAVALRVAAASDLSFSFREIGAAYEKATGTRVDFSFGSTGLLEKQLAEGAPFDVFAAADMSFADDAVKAGACLADSKILYATGRIVLFPAKDAEFAARSIADLADPRVTRIAIANAEHAPYGRAAKQAMDRAGVWDTVQSKVVYGDNVSQALQFALSGNADVAIVALSLAVATPGEWTVIPADLHDRLDQALVVCVRGKAGTDAGRRFAAYVGSPTARAVMHKYGFLLPGESMSEAKRSNTKP